ncbi:hypothetical protein ACFXJ8_10310 [Nonomuraea sp. NPDC059194]|uniref:hypothetical protein n=1 Tax=Nonomuraea sp. NPDC059194 TaxID=3346764 RepID=UPI003678A787
MTRWLTRDDLVAGSATGLLHLAPDASFAFPLRPELTELALRNAGVGERDRVVVALAEPAGGLWAATAAGVAEAAASVGPRGRMRLHRAIEALGATTLVATPTGAMDFLARLHLEFLLDPLDLGLRTIVLTGEIASRRTLGHLAAEFDARVSEVYSSPFSGGALAFRAGEDEPLTPLADGVLGFGALAKDSPVDEGLAELVVTHGEATVRTGHVTADGRLAHTVGDHVLVRGVWVSLPLMEKALSKIDGVSGWELAVSRQGTLDAAVLTVTFSRESLVENPMWRSRVRQALAALTPISIAVEVSPVVADSSTPGVATDHRGHHLGRDRALV